MWPLAGGKDRVVSDFGRRQDPIGGGNEYHTGIDIDGWKGERVYAADSGVVVYAGSKGGYGNMVMIDHGSGLITLYAHLSSIVVRAGQKASKGSTIGYVGSSGYSTGSHLHFEVREDGVQVDPTNYLPN
jgi:murein DD-endopeptidase MepM/ murein hydrolase activator NlpD